MSNTDALDDEQEPLSAAEQKAFDRVEDVKWLMGQLRGRRFMWDLLDKSGFRREPMTGNAQTYFNLGAAKIGREQEAELHAICPELYVQMIKENSNG